MSRKGSAVLENEF
uniref:Uncharacterized protein n=1 Tax=Arundo donax TaxID=35708 RepID=A0A0A8YLP6_ARUDO